MPPQPKNLSDLASLLDMDFSQLSITPVGGGSGSGVATVYNVKDAAYGATGYSSIATAAAGTDATSRIQSAINDANTAGGGTVYLPGFFRVSSALTLKQGVRLAGMGKGVSGMVFDDASGVACTATGTTTNTKTIAAGITAPTRTATVATVSGFATGDWVWVNQSSANRSWIVRLGAVKTGSPNDTLYFEDTVPCDFDGTTTIRKLTAVTDVSISDMTITTPTQSAFQNVNRRLGFLNAGVVRRFTISGCDFRGWAADNSNGCVVQFQNGNRDIRVVNCDFMDCTDADITPTQNTRTIQFTDVTHGIVSGNTFQRCGGSAAISMTATVGCAVNDNVIGGQRTWANNNQESFATTTTGSQTLPTSTLNVSSTTNFTASGDLFVSNGALPTQVVSYTGGGGGGTSFTGCTGGSGSVPAGTIVSQGGLPTDGAGRGIKWEIGNFHFACVGNVLNDIAFDGIRVTASRYGTVSGNTLYQVHDVGINLGPSSSSALGPCTHIACTGNRVWNLPASNFGIWAACSQSTISGNVVTNAGGTGSRGIRLSTALSGFDAVENVVTNNYVEGSDINIQGSANSAKNIIAHNVIRSTGTGASIDTSAGAGTSAIFGNIVDKAVSLNASDKKINDSAAASSNWVL